MSYNFIFDYRDSTCDRYTDRAKLVMALAYQFAMEQGVSDIQPEHVLRGLASTDRGVGRVVLEQVNVDIVSLLPELIQLMPKYKAQNRDSYARSEIGFKTKGKLLLQAIRRESKKLGHKYVGTEHIVLGLLIDNTLASKFLTDVGVTYDIAYEQVVSIVGSNT